MLSSSALLCPAAEQPSERFDETSRFIFYSVLEGLYEDGLSTADVDRILMKNEGESYFHFVYACPICTATIWALETYRDRPAHFYSLKSGVSTFGSGLSKKQHNQLYSPNSNERLIVINELVRKWLDHRMTVLKLSPPERKVLTVELEKKRKAGMKMLETFQRRELGENAGVETMAPAYVDLEECAVCNGAVGKLMKLPGE